MGNVLANFYAQVDKIGGLGARVRLACLTKMGSAQAEVSQDTEAHILLFEKAFATIQREMASGDMTLVKTNRVSREEEERQWKYKKVTLELMEQRHQFLSEKQKAIQHLTEVAAMTLEVERSSVWFYDRERILIRCHDLFSRKTGDHSEGSELFAKDFPPYFKALETERTIAAHDAHEDPRTSVFSIPYLKPLGINSMLDVPIWADSKMIGVVCHEHTGSRRTWLPEEEDFAYTVGSLVALAVEKHL